MIKLIKKTLLFAFFMMMMWPIGAQANTQHIYDYAQVLTDAEVAELEKLASALGEERETSFLVLTTDGAGGKDLEVYMGDFYDEEAPGYDKPHGNTVILAIDLVERDIVLAGFQKAEDLLDADRLKLIRTKITPALSSGNYVHAFSQYMELAHHYMSFRKGVNPENPIFNFSYQLIISLAVAGIVVFVMAFKLRSRVTVAGRDFFDQNRSKILRKEDTYVRTTLTRVRKPKEKSGGGGGSSGGRTGSTGGGRSYSRSRGKF